MRKPLRVFLICSFLVIGLSSQAAFSQERVFFNDGTSLDVASYEIRSELMLLATTDGKSFSIGLDNVDLAAMGLGGDRNDRPPPPSPPSVETTEPLPERDARDTGGTRSVDRIRDLLAMAEAHIATGNYAAAQQSLETARRESRGIADPELQASIAGVSANLSLAIGELDAAREQLDEAIRKASAVGAEDLAAASTTNQGTFFLAREQWDDAITSYQEGARRARAAGLSGLEARALANLGRAAARNENPALAASSVEEALDLALQRADSTDKAATLVLFLLFIHPRALLLIFLARARQYSRHDLVASALPRLDVQNASFTGARESRSSAAARRVATLGESGRVTNAKSRAIFSWILFAASSSTPNRLLVSSSRRSKALSKASGCESKWFRRHVFPVKFVG